jgi:hypothetical protein
MKVVFGGSCITSGTGKIGGTVIQGGPYGPIARMNFRPMVRNINNQFQPCEKESFTNVAKQWHALSGAQVAAWNAYAIAPLSGYATWLKFNLQYYRINNALLIAPVPLPLTPSSIVLNSATTFPIPIFNLNATFNPSANPNTLQLFVSINNSLGQVRCVKSRLRLVASMTAIAAAHNYTFNATLFSVSPILNASQFIGVRLFDTVTGFLSPMQIIQFNS